MALDSVSDRYSALNMGMPLLIILPEPDGSVTEVDRVHLLRLYGGIDLDEPTAGVTTYNLDSDAFSRALTLTRSISSVSIGLVGAAHFILKGAGKICTFSVRLTQGDHIDLTSFVLEVQIVEDGPWIAIVTAWGVAGSENGFVLHSRNVLETLVWDALGMAILSVAGLWGIRFKSAPGSAPTEPITETLVINITR
ncbi:hypothetical protein LCGC14_1177850 [marine sediment metagenome]|uniref:Uncharacterized protein n=1 Tax=marine sediment metagenome TaxID=412755 RepID=A0A0F9LN09_9ZZZZ